MSSKPTFVLVPGAWHSPEYFFLVSRQLNSIGYPTFPVTLPSVGGGDSVTGFDQDVARIRSTLSTLIQSGGQDVILVMHSYAGIPACEAAKGYAKAEIESIGLKGGIIRLVFLSGFVLTEGQSLFKKSGEVARPWHILDGDYLSAANPETIFYNDLDAVDARFWVEKLTHHSYSSFKSELTYAAWRHIPSIYLHCEDDNAIPLAVQEAMINTAGKEYFVTETVKASHTPMLSVPDDVVAVLVRAAGAEV